MVVMGVVSSSNQMSSDWNTLDPGTPAFNAALQAELTLDSRSQLFKPTFVTCDSL
jgi:hypothetical protein